MAAAQTGPNHKKQPSAQIATYNIRSGGGNNLQMACMAMDEANIDLAILTETKIPDEVHTHKWKGYDVVCTKAVSRRQGGIAILTRTSTEWHIESLLKHGPNVLSCIFVHGTQRIPLIGAYIPPSDLATLPFLTEALQRFPNDTPIVLGDLNANINQPLGARNHEIAGLVSAYGLEDMLPHFHQRRPYRHNTTFFAKRHGQTIRSQCDYILGGDRRLFQNVSIRDPRYFRSDHYMLRGTLLMKPTTSHKRYLNGRKSPFEAYQCWSQTGGRPSDGNCRWQQATTRGTSTIGPTPMDFGPHSESLGCEDHGAP